MNWELGNEKKKIVIWHQKSIKKNKKNAQIKTENMHYYFVNVYLDTFLFIIFGFFLIVNKNVFNLKLVKIILILIDTGCMYVTIFWHKLYTVQECRKKLIRICHMYAPPPLRNVDKIKSIFLTCSRKEFNTKMGKKSRK